MRANSLWVAMLLPALLAAAAQAETDPKLQQQYDARWSQTEAQATTKPARMNLAESLLQAAQAADHGPMRQMLCERAYYWGSQDCPDGYPTAARAMLLLQESEPAQRLACMEKLAYLFHNTYNLDRLRRLGSGADLAEVKYQLGRQRLLDLYQRHARQSLSADEFRETLTKARRDYTEAAAVLQRVLAVARSYKKKGRGTASQNVALASFDQTYTPLEREIERSAKSLDTMIADVKARGDAALPKFAPPTPRPAVAAAPARPAAEKPAPAKPAPPKRKPKPEPRPEPAAPSDPPQAPEPAAPEPTRVAAAEPIGAGGILGERRCTKCGEMFIPDPGSQDTTCYFCRKGKHFFSFK